MSEIEKLLNTLNIWHRIEPPIRVRLVAEARTELKALQARADMAEELVVALGVISLGATALKNYALKHGMLKGMGHKIIWADSTTAAKMAFVAEQTLATYRELGVRDE